MSKESYIRGFCKAAEAAGADPVALAKYAQQYKTEGWTPDILMSPDKMSIPFPTDYGFEYTAGVPPVPSSLWRAAHINGIFGRKRERLMRILDPRREAWNAATTNAARKAVDKLTQAGYRYSPDDKDEIPKNAIPLLEKIYHDEMKRTTSAPPAQVSSPAKK